MCDEIGFSSNRWRSLAVISHFKYISPLSGMLGHRLREQGKRLIKRSSSGPQTAAGVCGWIVQRLCLLSSNGGGSVRWLTFLCLRILQSADLNTSTKFKNKSRCAAYQHCHELIISQICKKRKTPLVILLYFLTTCSKVWLTEYWLSRRMSES